MANVPCSDHSAFPVPTVADDIVTERVSHPAGCTCLVCLMGQEIERLRSAGDALFHLIVDDIEWDTEEEDEIAERILHRWEEARRG